MVSAHQSIGCGAINLFGTDEQKKRWLPGLASGERIGTIAFAEPGYEALVRRLKGFDRLLEKFPGLRARLAGATASGRDRGAGPLAQRARVVVEGRVALVGDAAGYLDAITGEGLSLAFHQATSLAQAISSGDLDSYAKQWRRSSALPFALIRALLVAERRPWLRRRLIRTLAEEPGLFARLLAIHARERPLRALGVDNTCRLVWGLLR